MPRVKHSKDNAKYFTKILEEPKTFDDFKREQKTLWNLKQVHNDLTDEIRTTRAEYNKLRNQALELHGQMYELQKRDEIVINKILSKIRKPF